VERGLVIASAERRAVEEIHPAVVRRGDDDVLVFVPEHDG
jgi:hypothetical protein